MSRVIVLLTVTIFSALLCGGTKPTSNWPKEVTSSLIVPQNSKNVEYYELYGSYQVKYEVSVCYPADKFTKSLAHQMTSRGWKRLREDFLNPGLKNSWTRGGSIYEQWGFFEEKGEDVHQWIDDWEDNRNNIIRYGLQYRTKRKGNLSISSTDCNLQVVVIYTPKKLRPTAADLESMKKSN